MVYNRGVNPTPFGITRGHVYGERAHNAGNERTANKHCGYTTRTPVK
jgi:hypothetical protein